MGIRGFFDTIKTPIYHDNGQLLGVLGIARDITGLREAQQRAEYLALHDALTGLPNRTLLMDKAELALAQHQGYGLAVLCLDLDHFKSINDSLGHEVGDRLLVQLVARMQQGLRETDVLARMSGDEFLLLLSDADARSAQGMAERLLALLHEPVHVDGKSLVVTASVGIAVFPTDGQQVDVLLKNAEAAMYDAKSLGRNSYRFYNADMNSALLDRVLLLSALRQAIPAGQLRAYFQPKVDMRSGQLVGMEALVRWQHPQQGLVPPGQFIPLIENTDLVISVGEWMLETVCRQLAAWRDAERPLVPVAINLAASHFRRPGLAAQVLSVLRQHQVSPALLEIEITESALLESGSDVLGVMRTLAVEGVRFAIDDFGTGYSNLSYLRRLPVNTLKIDQAFVRDLESDAEDCTIAATVIGLAHGLGLSVVAEGVETRAQAEWLLSQGCDVAQGYLYARPVPSAQLETDWLG